MAKNNILAAGAGCLLGLTCTDPDTFTSPLAVKKIWMRRPGEQVKPYHCMSGTTARR